MGSIIETSFEDLKKAITEIIVANSREDIKIYKTVRYVFGHKEPIRVMCKFPLWKKTLVSYEVTEFLKDKNWEFIFKMYENLEVKSNEYSSLLVEAIAKFNGKDGNPIIFCSDPNWIDGEERNTYYCVFYGLESSKDEMETLAKELENKIKSCDLYRKCKITPFGTFLHLNKHSWDDLIVRPDIKFEIDTHVTSFLKNLTIYKKNGISPKRGLILSGDPGTGKTLTGKILASATDYAFIWVTPKYLTELSNLEVIMDMSRELAPCIVFMEDADLYKADRVSNPNPAVLGELLNKLDGLEENDGVVFIVTTNDPDALDKAVKDRPGRFDTIINFPHPDTAERILMLKKFSEKMLTGQVNWEEVSPLTENLTGAQLKEIINLAGMASIELKSYNENEIVILTNKLIEKAIKKFKKIKPTKTLGFNRDAEIPEGAVPKRSYWDDD